MGRLKKITVEIPEELLKRAQKDGEGITATIREALELKARNDAYDQLRALRGKVHLKYDIGELRRDRR